MKLETFFPYQLAIVAEAFSRNLTQVYGREFGLSREEWRLLFLLAEEEEVTSPDLARRTTLDKVQVTRASQRLEEKGLLTRKVAESDRRLRIYRCTDAGRALFAEALPRVEGRARRILGEMSRDDLEALVQGLTALRGAMARIDRTDDEAG
ncbi:MAG: MarR family transcriptional regulator [Rhodobacteraceae bacterium]|nr:MAG: MarR family transcriptional regulator [Paracoccaceae bacterium]